MKEKDVRRVVKEEVNDAFAQLFIYLDKRFAEIDKRFASIDARFDSAFGALDGHEKRIENLEQDHAAGNSQLAHHDQWINQLAISTNTPLSTS